MIEYDGVKRVRLFINGKRYYLSLSTYIANNIISHGTYLDYNDDEFKELMKKIREVVSIKETVDLIIIFLSKRLTIMSELGVKRKKKDFNPPRDDDDAP